MSAAFSAERLLAHEFPPVRHAWTERDAILYALGVGLGQDPMAGADLARLDETRLEVLPTFAVTLASPGLWVREPSLGVDWVKLLHVAQSAHFLRPLPPRGEAVGHARVAGVTDRGAERGAEMVVERRIVDGASGETLCVLEQTLLMRGNGGFAAAPAPRPVRPEMPARAADVRRSFETPPNMALVYRLSGDWNPLHIDPETACKAGFARPILHGLASYGLAGWIAATSFGETPERLASLGVRFAGVVTPGDKVDFELWRGGKRIDFRASVDGRTVLDQGVAELA